MSKALLLSETTLKKYSHISDNVDGKYLLSAIQAAQDVDLTDLIGPALVTKLCNLVSDGSIYSTTDYYNLLVDYVQPYMIWTVMQSLQLVLDYKIANSGTYVNNDSNKSALGFRENQALQEQYIRYANSYATKLKNYLLHNTTKFPEYNQCVNGESEMDVPTYGIYLGDIRINRCDYKYK